MRYISALSNTFAKDPQTVVRAGHMVRVPQASSNPEQRGDRTDGKRLAQHQKQEKAPAPAGGSMAAAFAKLRS